MLPLTGAILQKFAKPSVPYQGLLKVQYRYVKDPNLLLVYPDASLLKCEHLSIGFC